MTTNNGQLQLEAKRDYSDELKTIIPQSIEIANSVGLDQAITLLLGLERRCRTNNDFNNLKEVCLHMVRLCRENSNWEKLNSTLITIDKRRSQSQLAISAVVSEAMKYIDDAPSQDAKVALIKTLMEVSGGKIYVEAECSKLHLMLAHIYEKEGDYESACEAIQNVQVETYGALDKKQKAEYILEQIRLNLIKKDFIRAMIHSRKMNRKVIEEVGFEEIKVSFFYQQIEYFIHEKDTWEICRAYFKIFETLVKISGKETQTLEALQGCISFAIFSPYSVESNTLMHYILRLKYIETHPTLQALVTLFTTKEIIAFPFAHQDMISTFTALVQCGEKSGTYFLGFIRKRVIQYNIRIIASYYKRARMGKIGILLGLSIAEAEDELSEMSFQPDLNIRINRPLQIVTFSKVESTDEVLNAWSSTLRDMVSQIETTCHLINRENMVHGIVC